MEKKKSSFSLHLLPEENEFCKRIAKEQLLNKNTYIRRLIQKEMDKKRRGYRGEM